MTMNAPEPATTDDLMVEVVDTAEPLELVAPPVAPPGPSLWRLLPLMAGGLVVWFLVYRQLQPFANWLTYEVLGLAEGSHLGEAVAFFLYDAPKVMMLLGLIVWFVGVLRTFFSPTTTRRLLAGRRESAGNVAAAGLGVLTPFCSCSAVPLFIGFVDRGRAAGGHLLLPHRGAHGERGGAGAALRPLRLEGGRCSTWSPGLASPSWLGWIIGRLQAGALGGSLGLRDQSRASRSNGGPARWSGS